MARPLRIDIEGGWYHITARGHNRGVIYLDAQDRKHFLDLMAESVERFTIEIHAYVLMDNHYHILIRTPKANASRAMQWLNVSYSVWWNRRHGRCGNVFQGRFKSILVENGSWVLDASEYVHLNPVTVKGLGLSKRSKTMEIRGLGPAPSGEVVRQRLETLRGYAWSSYRAFAGYERAPEWLEMAEVWRRARGKVKYRERIEHRLRSGVEENLWLKLKWGTVLGGKEFAEKIRKKVRIHRETSGQRVIRQHKTWEEIVDIVEQVKGEKWPEFCNRHGDKGRDLALWAARRWGGLTLCEAGKRVGDMDYTAVGMAVRRIEQQCERDEHLRVAMHTVRAKCEM